MLKVDPAPDYPTEEGRYLRGNDYSPVAVAVILIYDSDKIPKDIEMLVRTGVEAGAALHTDAENAIMDLHVQPVDLAMISTPFVQVV